ncbi:acyl-CoA-binding protein homolog 1-like [Styela clava]
MLSTTVRTALSVSRRICVRHIGLSASTCNSGIDGKFEAAIQKLGTLTEDPDNSAKLKIYGLFKQATLGKNTTDKPGAFNFVAQAKWAAWNDLGEMTQDEAKQAYVDIVDDLASKA